MSTESTTAGRIEARGLTKRYGEHLALAPLDVELEPGSITGLLGPNGSGKTTLLRMLYGLVRPTSGSASVDGVALSGDGVGIRRRATYMPGETALLVELSGRAHLDWLLRGRPRATRQRARAIATDLGLPLRARVRSYSHGMKRQLLLAAALAPDVPVRLLDEASEGLDPRKRGQVVEFLRADAARGTTILLSSHHLGEVDRACQRMIFLSEGRVLASEDAASVAARAATVVHVAWADEATSVHAAERLDALPGWTAQPRENAVIVHLETGDPRPFLARLAELDLPAPTSVEYGRLSLRELFRDLYGVEGI